MRELLLYTGDAARAHAEVEEAGGEVRQVFTPHLFVAVVPDEATLAASSDDLPADLDETSRMMAEAWRSRSTKARDALEGLPWDTPGYEPPR